MFYNDHSSFANLLEMMQSERERMDADSPLNYHINLVTLLACCTEGKNVYTEIKCHSLLPLDDIVRIVTHPDCIPEVSKFSQTCCFCTLFALFGTLFTPLFKWRFTPLLHADDGCWNGSDAFEPIK